MQWATLDQVEHTIRSLRLNKHRGEALWFTSGCFDCFHPGHLYFLRQAAHKASRVNALLMVGVNSDISVLRYKARPPIWSTEARMELVAATSVVNFIFPFDERHPIELVQRLKPDAIVHGTSTGRPAFSSGRDKNELKGYEGRIELIEIPPEYSQWSTTNIREHAAGVELGREIKPIPLLNGS